VLNNESYFSYPAPFPQSMAHQVLRSTRYWNETS